MATCPFCQSAIAVTASSCALCGRELPPEAVTLFPHPELLVTPAAPISARIPSPQSTLLAPPSATARLVVVRGIRMNVEYKLRQGRNVLGRGPGAEVDIDLDDQEPTDQAWASRRHAVVKVEPEKVTIEDLASLNGTLVNRAKIPPGKPLSVQAGDIIQIGTVQLKLIL